MTRTPFLQLTCTVIVLLSFYWNPALASTEPDVNKGSQQTLQIDMGSFTPDQSDWSQKQIAKYEKKKNTGDLPLAMLKIERLNLEAPVYLGTDRITLDRGLGIIESTAYLGEVGNIGISGHRDGFFRPLKDIKLGDTIEILTPTGVEEFEVSDITIVDALEVSVLDPTDTTVLTLITCHPFYYQGYAPDRYIVRAIPVGSDANAFIFPPENATHTFE
jgi:LPXTG-site transpeptidase (sortase) family protein